MRLRCYTFQAYSLQSSRSWPWSRPSRPTDGTIGLHIHLQPSLFFGQQQESLQPPLCATFQTLGTGRTGNAMIAYGPPCCTPRYSFADQELARLLELPRGHQHTHRHRPHCLTADHDLEDTNINGQKGIHLFLLRPSHRVSHPNPVPALALRPIQQTESSQPAHASSSSGTSPKPPPTPPSITGPRLSAPRSFNA